MTGWHLILILLLLGGVLSTLGDRLGSRIGKARLSLFNLRPRSTAVLITVLTGSLISALSLGLMLLVSRQLRVGLFELNDLQSKLRNSRQELEISRVSQLNKDADMRRTEEELRIVRKQINEGEKELKQLQSNLIAFRKGDVVLSSGQPLVTVTLKLETPSQSKGVIDRVLQDANLEAYKRVLPGEKPNRQILLVPRGDINRLERIIRKKGTWVVIIRSAANVLLGERLVYAFPDVRPNITVVAKDEVIARTILEVDERTSEDVRRRLKLLLASTLSEIKRRGSLSSGLRFDTNSINELGTFLMQIPPRTVELESVALQSGETPDSISVELRIRDKSQKEIVK